MEAIRKFTEHIFKEIPDFRVEIQDVFAKGNRVCARFNIAGTASGEGPAGKTAAGKKISVPAAFVLEWKEGKIFKSYNYRNVALAMMQFGFVPAPQPERKQE